MNKRMNKLRNLFAVKHSRLTWRLLLGYVLTLIGYTAALFLFVLLAADFFGSVLRWRGD